MIKMAIKDAVNYIVKGDGMAYNDEQYAKIENFILNLPHNPKETKYTYIGEDVLTNVIVKDYEKESYFDICYGVVDGRVFINVVDDGNLSFNPSRLKSNKDALTALKQYMNLKYADDIEPDWYLSNDVKIIDWGNRFNERTESAKKDIIAML